MKKRILAFAGRKQSGKTMLAKHIAEKNNGVVIPIANALKHLCADIIKTDISTIESWKNDKNMTLSKMIEYGGFKTINEWVDYANSKIKQTIFDGVELTLSDSCNIIKKVLTKKINGNSTVRDLYQIVGTDIIRQLCPNWHILKTIEAIKSCDKETIIVDDVRFPNEKNAIEEIGGVCFFVIRNDNIRNVSNHESERSLFWFNFNDSRIILNLDSSEKGQQNLFKEFDLFMENNYNFHYTYYDYTILKVSHDEYEECNMRFGLGNLLEYEEEAINEIINNDLYLDYGIISLVGNTYETVRKYQDMLYVNKKTLNYETYRFLIDNPIIVENLKLYVNR